MGCFIQCLEPRVLLTAGGLDASFGNGGKVTTSFAGRAAAEANVVLALPGGKVAAAGVTSFEDRGETLSVFQFLADGKLDPSFGSGGIATQPFSRDFVGTDLVRQDDGKLIVAGFSNLTFLVARLNANGTVDTTFGGGGWIADGFRFGISSVCLRLTADGKVLVGIGGSHGLDDTVDDVRVRRLNSDGTTDSTFASFGTLEVDLGHASDFAGFEVAPDGRIVVGGSFFDPSIGKTGVAIYRFTPDGQSDSTFAGVGKVTGRLFAGSDHVTDLALDSAGRVLLLNEREDEMAVARFRTDGVLDRSFGQRGVRAIPLVDARVSSWLGGDRLLVGADGRITAMGPPSSNSATGRLVFPVVRLTTGGVLDSTLSGGGVDLVAVPTGATIRAIDLLPGGGVMGAGFVAGGALAAVRISAGGLLDLSFGTKGLAQAPGIIRSSSDSAEVMARQPDGKILLGGSSFDASGDWAVLARYLPDGALDTGFGSGGRVAIAWARSADPSSDGRPSDTDGAITGIEALAGGKILLVTSSGLAARLNADGSPDLSFGFSGQIHLISGSAAVRVLPNGQFITVSATDDVQEFQTVLRRYNSDGSLDNTFGADGSLLLHDFAFANNAILILAGGGILIAGYGSSSRFTLVRLNSDGSFDSTFGSGGKTRIDVGGVLYDTPNTVALQKDGRIIVAGYQSTGASSRFALTRFNANGAPDLSFGNRGVVVTALPPGLKGGLAVATDFVSAVVVQDDGKILAVGRHIAPQTLLDEPALYLANGDWAILRYNPDGSLDNSFGDFGKVFTNFGLNDSAAAAFLTADGKLVVGGTAEPPGVFTSNGFDDEFGLTRYLLTDPNPITAGIENGVLKIKGTSGNDTIRLRIVDAKLAVSGVAQSFALSAFSRIEISALNGNDVVDASAARIPLSIDGGNGNDSLLGGSASDVLTGNAGNDTLFGGGGADTLRGGDGNDYLNGGPGADFVYGEGGNDQIYAVDGAVDSVDGGEGFDRAKRDAQDLLAQIEGLLG